MWKDIEGYEGLYMVSDKGYVVRNGKKLKVRLTKTGYARIGLCKNNKAKDFYLHRLVANAFIDNPNNKVTVNHKDGDKLNNSVSNLEWATHSENIIHSYKQLGRISVGGAPIGNDNWKKTKRNKLGQYVKTN
jgi:hypothetical protein